jgi:hypothetical protein
MDVVDRLRSVDAPAARAAIIRAALLELDPPVRAVQVAAQCRTYPSTVSNVLQGKMIGGVKGRTVQDVVAGLLHCPVDQLFPDRGPAATGFHAQRRNRQGARSGK